MTFIHDNTELRTEDELIEISKHNGWTVGEVLSNYTGEVKLARIVEELDDMGDIKRWAADCRCSADELTDLLIDYWDDPANLTIHKMLPNNSVRCTIRICGDKRLYLQLNVAQEDYATLECRISKLEKLMFNM